MRKAKYEKEWYTVGIGDAGVYGSAPNRWSSTPTSCSTYDTRLEFYLYRLMDGGTVIDKRPVFKDNEETALRGVIAGPMLNAALPERTIDRLFEGLKADQDDPEIAGGMDMISLDLYVKYWQKRGARIGKRDGDVIRWSDGETEQIEIPAWQYEEQTA